MLADILSERDIATIENFTKEEEDVKKAIWTLGKKYTRLTKAWIKTYRAIATARVPTSTKQFSRRLFIIMVLDETPLRPQTLVGMEYRNYVEEIRKAIDEAVEFWRIEASHRQYGVFDAVQPTSFAEEYIPVPELN